MQNLKGLPMKMTKTRENLKAELIPRLELKLIVHQLPTLNVPKMKLKRIWKKKTHLDIQPVSNGTIKFFSHQNP